MATFPDRPFFKEYENLLVTYGSGLRSRRGKAC